MSDPPTLPIDTRFSDLTIVCDLERFKVHKVIMCNASPVIAKACEIDMREARTGIIEHECFGRTTLERMISYVYTKKYEVTPFHEPNATTLDGSDSHDESGHATEAVATVDTAEQATETDEDLLAIQDLAIATPQMDVQSSCAGMIDHVHVYGIAEYYDIASLRQAAVDNFTVLFEATWKRMHPSDFAQVIEEMCHCSRRGDALQTKLLSLLGEHPELATCRAFTMTLGASMGVGSFTADLLQELGAWVRRSADENAQMITTLKAKVDNLQQSLEDLQTAKDEDAANAKMELQRVNEREQHTDQVMDNLVASLRGLDNTCSNGRCEVTFGDFVLERKGHNRFEGGDWVLRCGRKGCRARLN